MRKITEDKMNEQEARKELHENPGRYNQQANKFCPQINGKCQPNCVCYYQAAVTARAMVGGEREFRVVPAYCAHVLIYGYIIIGQ
jgi:hypothetical protein